MQNCLHLGHFFVTVIKHKHRLRKKTANNDIEYIHSHWHLTGHALMVGAHKYRLKKTSEIEFHYLSFST